MIFRFRDHLTDMKNGKTIGLALSGGAVKGFAHLGVLQALEETGYKPDYISGTSAGAIAAALDRKSTRLNSSHTATSRMPSSA